jgi:hypothetical protein
MRELVVKMNSESISDESLRTNLQYRLCMLAATCFSTFNVCPEHISATLVNEEDFSIAMECAVIVNVNTPSSLSGDDLLYLNRMLSRHRRLLHSLEPLFSQSLPTSRGRARLLHAGTYDRALTRLMPGYRQGSSSSWHVLHKQNSRWICCVTGGGQKVHYDLLTGKLLIGGKSSGRLPQEMVEHSTYKSIFGKVSVQISSFFGPFLKCFQRVFDVAPADMPGMEYMTWSTMFGYQVKHYYCSAFCIN